MGDQIRTKYVEAGLKISEGDHLTRFDRNANIIQRVENNIDIRAYTCQKNTLYHVVWGTKIICDIF